MLLFFVSRITTEKKKKDNDLLFILKMQQQPWYYWAIVWFIVTSLCLWIPAAYFYMSIIYVMDGLTTKRVWMAVTFSACCSWLITSFINCFHQIYAAQKTNSSPAIRSIVTGLFTGYLVNMHILNLSTLVLYVYGIFWLLWQVAGLSLYFSIYFSMAMTVPLVATGLVALTNEKVLDIKA